MSMDSVRKSAAAVEAERDALEKKIVDLQVAVAHSKNSLSNGGLPFTLALALICLV